MSDGREELDRRWEAARTASWASISTTDFDDVLDDLLSYVESDPQLRQWMEEKLVETLSRQPLEERDRIPPEVLCHYVHRLSSPRVNAVISALAAERRDVRSQSFFSDLQAATSPDWDDVDLFPSLTKR